MRREISGDTRGGISILSALAITGVIGFAALALEYGYGLLQQVENQRVADLAAYSGALVYNSTSSTSSTNSAVGKMASLNGLTSSAASSSLISSPSGDGNQAVQATVTTSAPLLLARVLTTNTTMPVAATAYAEINANAPGCVIALSGSGSGISLSGTGSITANNCQVESNTTICANSGANPSDSITTKYLSYGSGTNPASSNCTISPPSGTSSVHISKATASDPLAGNSEVSGATGRIGTVASMASPSSPSGVPTGTSVTFKNTPTLPSGCSTTNTSSPYTVTCTGTGPFNFGSFTNSNSSVTINNTSSGATYNFSGLVDSGTGNSLTFNGGSNAIYNMAQGIYVHGSATMTFGTGSYNMGPNSSCSSSNTSICNKGTSLTFNGPNIFVLAGGIYNGGGSSMALGSGSSSNSYNIGAAGDGNSINASTSQIMTFGDATGSGDLFRTGGNITSGGGSCLALPAAAEHDIKGNISGAGGVVLGAGIYTVTGYVNFGGGGGDVSNCPTSGTTTGLSGSGVTLVAAASSGGVTCGSITSAFCLGSGYSTVTLTAPSSGSTAGLAVIGPQSSSNTAGAGFTNGAANTTISGAFYFPNGPIYMSGAATLHDTVDASACLELIGSTVTATAGTAAGSTCAGLGSGSTGTTIGLVK